MAHCQRVLADHPLAQPSASGMPLGDGSGMEAIVAEIAPVFSREGSMVRWVALRGALLDLDIACPDLASWESLVRAMGLQSRDGRITIVDGAHISPAEAEMAIGLAVSIHSRLMRYAEAERASFTDMNSAPFWAAVQRSIGLDYICWTAIALNRVGHTPQPELEPGRLESPGFYAEPVFAKAERYWDGTDWTSRVRRVGEKSEVELPLL